jgi:hypothetical protein
MKAQQQEKIKSWWKNIMQISFPLKRLKLSNSKIQMDGTIQLIMKEHNEYRISMIEIKYY